MKAYLSAYTKCLSGLLYCFFFGCNAQFFCLFSSPLDDTLGLYKLLSGLIFRSILYNTFCTFNCKDSSCL